jgi:hypothetical protein
VSPDPAVTEAAAEGEQEPRSERVESAGPPSVRAPRRAGTAAAPETPEAVAKAAKASAATSTDAPSGTPAPPPATAPPAKPESDTSPSRRLVTAEEVMTRRQRKHVDRLRARKVRRVVRHVDAWTVLKVSLLFYLCSYVIGLVSGVILWNVADRAGYIEKVEGFIEDLFAYETFEFLPGTLFTAVALGGAILAIVATGLTALGAVLFNLISDLVGGVRLTMVELPGAKPAVRPRKAARLAAKAVPD